MRRLDPEVLRWARTIAEEWYNGARLESLDEQLRRDVLAAARAHVRMERAWRKRCGLTK